MISVRALISGRKRFMGITAVFFPACAQPGMSDCRVRIVCKQPSMPRKRSATPTLAVLSGPAVNQFLDLNPPKRIQWVRRLLAHKTLLILLAETLKIPNHIKQDCLDCGVTIAASRFDAHLASSRLLSLRFERLLKTVSLPGVVIEIDGRGVMIAGPSGIGKTTAALRYIKCGANWIADDVAVIQKRPGDGLIVSGHPRIRHCVWTDSHGVQTLESLNEDIRIKRRTPLKAVIDVRRDSVDTPQWAHEETSILGVKTKKISCRISNTGYLDENLLKKMVTDL